MNDFLFESIEPSNDYNEICNKVLYQENIDKLGETTEEEFISMDDSTRKRISDDLGLNYKFVLTFGTSITAFFPIIESFIINSGIDDIHLDKSTVVYLGICALAIALDNPKKTYRKLFSELRLRNVYGLLEDMTVFIKVMKDIFNYITSTIGKITYDIVGMFNYTALFVPFALTISSLLDANKIGVDSIVDAFGENGLMKLTSSIIGITGITIRIFIVDIIKNISNFSFSKVSRYLSRSFSKIKNKINSVISKLNKSIDIDRIESDLKSKESDNKSKSTSDILKWSQWKKENDLPHDVERIDEEI